jgi:hypothetical protein
MERKDYGAEPVLRKLPSCTGLKRGKVIQQKRFYDETVRRKWIP